MAASAISTSFTFSNVSHHKHSSISHRSSKAKSIVCAYSDLSKIGLSSSTQKLQLTADEKNSHALHNSSYNPVVARRGNPPIMPAVITPGGPLDLSTVLFRNRIIFVGQPINSQVAQRVISQLVTLATIDEHADILVYVNCPGGSTYSVLAIYDCMSWIKPKVGTVCFGVAASEGALLLAGGEKGMRYAMPNARIMIHQPQSGCGGHVEDVRRQVNEAVQSRQKIDMMYSAFTGQPLEKVQQYTERDRFLSVSEALEFGLIDGILETEY
ncbi:hypothetical protein OSB04_030563 [Centaurea solstitialis]|uniref:ATP-dependent Clp protease proteolytic subunit n=1 Tax=Centaurea solstitialis TaxID=347529 RepID=A0AA38W3Y3_9ASTR|nr:hypothetical protein OSB04_030563 [Centaurea solstitialis]